MLECYFVNKRPLPISIVLLISTHSVSVVFSAAYLDVKDVDFTLITSTGIGGIKIPEVWMPTIKKHNKRTVQQQSGTMEENNGIMEDRNVPITAHHHFINGVRVSS